MKIYTEEDLRNAYRSGSDWGRWYQLGDFMDEPMTEDEYIKSLNDSLVNYTDEDIEKAYKAGQSRKTFYKKNGTVILPDNYQGVDG